MDDIICQQETTPPKHRNQRATWWRWAGLAIATGVTLLAFLLRNSVRHLDQYGYVGIFLLSLIGNATVVLPMPSFLTVYAGGGIFNPVIVGMVAATGATLGELTGYLAGASGQTVIEEHAIYQRIHHFMQRRGHLTLFLLALIPNPLFDVAGMIAGVLRFPVLEFFAVTWAGKVLKFWGLAFLGAQSATWLNHFLPSGVGLP